MTSIALIHASVELFCVELEEGKGKVEEIIELETSFAPHRTVKVVITWNRSPMRGSTTGPAPLHLGLYMSVNVCL